MAQENHTLAFTALSAKQKQVICEDTEEGYISYTFLHQSGAQHGNLKVDLRNDFTTGSNQYPKTHQQTLHLLDKYSKTVVVHPRQLHLKYYLCAPSSIICPGRILNGLIGTTRSRSDCPVPVEHINTALKIWASQDIVYGNESPCEQNYSTNIHGI